MKKGVIILAAAMLIAMLAGCGKQKSDEEKLQEAFQEAFQEAMGSLGANAPEAGTPEAVLKEAQNFVTSELWNDGFVDLSWFISSGTSSTGDSIDIAFTVEQLGKSIEKKAEMDQAISGLSDNYKEAKALWEKLSAETDKLYEYVKANPPVAESEDKGYDTGLFKQYQEAFDKEVDTWLNSLDKK